LACAAVDTVPVDAAIDESLVPFTTTGTTPAGPLDDVRFIRVGFLAGFCQAGYYATLYRTNELHDEAVVVVFIPMDETMTEPPTGTMAAEAWLGSDYTQRTDQVSFEVVQVDLPSVEPFQIAGRVTASTSA
jgi:hypothetical protein